MLQESCTDLHAMILPDMQPIWPVCGPFLGPHTSSVIVQHLVTTLITPLYHEFNILLSVYCPAVAVARQCRSKRGRSEGRRAGVQSSPGLGHPSRQAPAACQQGGGQADPRQCSRGTGRCTGCCQACTTWLHNCIHPPGPLSCSAVFPCPACPLACLALPCPILLSPPLYILQHPPMFVSTLLLQRIQ